MAARVETGKVAKVEGLKELQAKLRDILNASTGEEARKVIGAAADDLRRDVAARIMTVPAPVTIRQGATSRGGTGIPAKTVDSRSVLASLFSYNRQAQGARRGMLSALVGISKRGRSRPYAAAYVQWRAGRHPKSERAKQPPGTLLGESLATMWELGTSKWPARPFFRPAVQAARARIVQTIAEGYRSIIERHAK